MGKTAAKKTATKGKTASKKTTKSSKKAEAPVKVVDVAKHRLVPKHEVLSQKEIDALFEKFEVQPTNLPTILATDPALAGLDAKMGDIIKITRNSLTAGVTTYYRRVQYE